MAKSPYSAAQEEQIPRRDIEQDPAETDDAPDGDLQDAEPNITSLIDKSPFLSKSTEDMAAFRRVLLEQIEKTRSAFVADRRVTEQNLRDGSEVAVDDTNYANYVGILSHVVMLDEIITIFKADQYREQIMAHEIARLMGAQSNDQAAALKAAAKEMKNAASLLLLSRDNDGTSVDRAGSGQAKTAGLPDISSMDLSKRPPPRP
jgi:hypothetical protein